MKSYKRSFIGLAFTTTLIGGCAAPLPSEGPAPGAAAAQQLEAARSALAAGTWPVALTGYRHGAVLASLEEVAALEEALTHRDAPVPAVVDGPEPRYVITTIGAHDALDRNAPPVKAQLEQLVFPALHPGQRTFELSWVDGGGVPFSSRCVYDEHGIVYDQILSNLAIVEAAAQESARPRKPMGLIPQGTSSFQVRALELTIKWLWGSTRGKIMVDHSILWNGADLIYSQSAVSDAWMQLGSAEAQTRETDFDRERAATIAYGYAWATPTASFKISFTAKEAGVGGAFDVSLSGVGSKGGGHGEHNIYLP